MTTYVAGVAATDEQHLALDWAMGAAGPDDAVVAVHAWEIPIVTGFESVATVDTRAIEDSSRQFVEGVLAERADARLTGRLATGHPGQAIVDAVEELGREDAVIVVGHAGSTKVGLLLGSTAQFVVQHAEVPVVVARGELRLPVRTIVVGVDDSGEDEPDPPSQHALRWALRYPGATRVEVHHAAFVPGVAAGVIAQPSIESGNEVDELADHLRRAIAEACDGGQPPNGAEVVPVVTGGTGAFAMIEASREADLIVVGTRGQRSFIQLVTGSTTLEVTAHAHCPVAVVR